MDRGKINLRRYIRLLPELVVIFLSVLMAFFVDDYRESKNEEAQYKSDLSIFKLELIADMNDVKKSLDSFNVYNDASYRGKLYRQLLKQIWLDSLIKTKKATLKDFQFIIETTDLVPKPELQMKSPLPEEIRIKYDEHIQDTRTIKWLRVYLQEMGALGGINEMLYDAGQSLNQLLKKTNPYLEFDKQDSTLFYSKEFIWNYRNMVSIRRHQYLYSKYLVEKRLIDVLDGMNDELKSFGISTQSDSCVRFNYYKRFICENGRPVIASDSLLTIEEIVIKERKKYFDKLKSD